MGNNTSAKEQDFAAVGATSRQPNDDAAAYMAEAGGLCSRLELSIGCNNLLNMDRKMIGGSLSDPFVATNVQVAGRWQEIGRTEVIANNLNPDFIKRVVVLYRFEEIQQMRFDVYDCDTPFISDQAERLDLTKQDFQGSISCTLSEIASGVGRKLTKPLTKPQGGRVQGTITICATEQANQNASLRLRFRGQASPKTVKPFFRINCTKEAMGGTLQKTVVYKSEVLDKPSPPGSPIWAALEVNVSTLCQDALYTYRPEQGDFFQPIVIEVFSWHKSGKHTLLGEGLTSPDQLLRGGKGHKVECGALRLVAEEASLLSRPSFLDYIRGGCSLQFIVAIDFTASNGNPADPRSLHFFTPHGSLNQYAAAITYVADVLSFYDTDHKYACYGFGGQVGGSRFPVSHCFALNGDPSQPEVQGIPGILEAYKAALESTQLSGPTVFSHVLAQANRIASLYHRRMDEQSYHILLIITDGIINDMDATIDEVIRGSALPLSVLIVGVGDADFTNMDILDSDNVKLRNSSGRTAIRDIVQFVPVRAHLGPQGLDRTSFSKALLEELPGQIVEYYSMEKIAPRPAPPAPSAIVPPTPPPMKPMR